MPYSALQTSPLVPGISPARIYYRDQGEGVPLFFLHGGWGFEMYPFNRQIESLRNDYRVISPDRSGYGRSPRLVAELLSDFHYHAATETLGLMDSLRIERAFFWGHSDGAVIAAILGFTAPERVSGLILEAFHYYRFKPASRKFFEALAYKPEALGAEMCEKFASKLGADCWRQLITTHAKAWLQIANERAGPSDDLYAGRLREVITPTLFIHGRLDPRTEPGELDAVRRQLPQGEMHILDNGSHSPHSESATTDLTTRVVTKFLRKIS